METQATRVGQELAKQILRLAALKVERKATMADFKAQEETISKEIGRLAMEVRTGQKDLFAKGD